MMQTCKITWVVLLNYFQDNQAKQMFGGKDLKHKIGHIHLLKHNIGWLRPKECSCELCISTIRMISFCSSYSCLMPNGSCDSLFVLVDVQILCLVGKQR